MVSNGYMLRKGPYDSIKARTMLDFKLEEDLAKTLDRFSELDLDVAIRLLDARYATVVAKNSSSFKKEILPELVDALFESGNGNRVLWSLHDIEGLDHNDIANRLIEYGFGDEFIRKIREFRGLDIPAIGIHMIESGYSLEVAKRPIFFKDIPGLKIIDTGYIADKRDTFPHGEDVFGIYFIKDGVEKLAVSVGRRQFIGDPDEVGSMVLEYAIKNPEELCDYYIGKPQELIEDVTDSLNSINANRPVLGVGSKVDGQVSVRAFAPERIAYDGFC